MRTFSIQTLGCKVNQYEGEQIATLLRSRGLVPATTPEHADLRVINTCSVTIQAASKSRQTVRRSTRLPVLQNPDFSVPAPGNSRSRVIVTGCWATSDRAAVERIAGVDAVLGHHDNVAAELHALLDAWNLETDHSPSSPKSFRDDVWMNQAGNSALQLSADISAARGGRVKQKLTTIGTRSLPILHDRQTAHQRAFLKIQDGCDAHCTYCIIPRLRSSLWSKPVDQVVAEARAMVEAGHLEVVLTGIFLGAYGQPTALRRRQDPSGSCPLVRLVEALCTQVPGLRRLRFSSMEPGDMTDGLLGVMRSHPQVVPHFHLPLQSGSDSILRRMNRQYTRDDFLRMVDEVHRAFDRPAITTDIIVGFPGESATEFERTFEVVDRVKFIHIHAFSFSPRPGTAAARWTEDLVHGPVVNERIDALVARGESYHHDFCRQFTGQTVELLVERPRPFDTLRHGRSERYFDVWFEDAGAEPGDAVRVRIDRVTPHRILGTSAATAQR